MVLCAPEAVVRISLVASILSFVAFVGFVGFVAGCRPPQPQAPTPAEDETSSDHVAPSAKPVASATRNYVETAVPLAGVAPSKREGSAVGFAKAIGMARTPRIAADRGGVIVAVGGGCNDPLGPLAAGARDPGSFVVLAKLDGQGARVWTHTFFGACADPATENGAPEIAGVGVDRAGNVYLAGDLTTGGGPLDFGGGALANAGGRDVFVASFDPTGQHRWSKRFGNGADQSARGVAVSPEGLVAITGSLEGSVDFGGGVYKSAGKSDAFIAVFDSAGQPIASHSFGDPSDQHGRLIAFGSQGELMLAGSYEGTIDFGGGPLPVGKTARDFLALYSDNGPGSSPRYAFAFARALPADVVVGGLAGSIDGIYLAGEFRGAADFGGGSLKAHEPEDRSAAATDAYLVKLSGAGKYLFGRSFGLGGTHRIEGLAMAGDLWMAGEFSGMTRFAETMVSAGGRDALLVRFDPESGDAKGAWRFGDTFAQGFSALASAGASSSLYLLARSSGTIDFGAGPQSERGAFVVNLTMDPTRAAGRAPESPKGGADGGAP
jgi:hypothetical protein